MSIRRLVPPLVLATVTLVVLLALRPLPTVRAFAIWIILLTAIALHALVRRDPERAARRTSRFEAALRPRARPEPEPPAALVRLERELVLGSSTVGDASRRLLPRLRGIAATRLATRHGIELDRRPDEAHAVLGDDVWDLLRPDRPRPDDPNARGIPRSRIAAVVDRLEAL